MTTGAGARLWVLGARPRTLGAAVVPVVVGTAAAATATWPRTLGALAVALGMQVGVNYANDYFDGRNGVDTAERVGPMRLTASGLVRPRAVLVAALLSFAVSGAAGLWLAIGTEQPEILLIGAAAIVAALAYSGGPAYASRGLGEVFVFGFFGIVATCGTAYVQSGGIPAAAWWSAIGVGLLAVAILMANNLRDIPTDTAAGKRTLAVRVGDGPARGLYRATVVVAYLVPVLGLILGALPAATLFTLASLPLAAPVLAAAGSARGPELIRVLVGTAATQVSYGAMLAAGLWLG